MFKHLQDNTETYANTPKSIFSSNVRTMSRNHSAKGFQQDINQFEAVIDRERHKFKQNKQKFEIDIGIQRNQRIQLENRLLKLKEELACKVKYISELQYKLNSFKSAHQDLKLDCQRMTKDLQSAREAYEHKLGELQNHLSEQQREHREQVQTFSTQFEKFRREGNEYLQTMTFQYDRKIKNLQQKLLLSQNSRKQLQTQTKRLNDMMYDQQITYQQEIRSSISRVRDQQNRKYQTSLKILQQKLRASDEIRQTFIKKNQQILRQLQQKDQTLSNLSIQKNQQIHRLQLQIDDYKDRIQLLKINLQKANGNLNRKQHQSSKIQSSHDSSLLKHQLQTKKKQNQNLNLTIKQLRQTLKQINSQNQKKRSQLVEKSNYLQSQLKKSKAQNNQMWQNIRMKLNDTITQASRQ